MNGSLAKLRIFGILVFLPLMAKAQPAQEFARLGNFKLEDGQVIENCVLGYRTCGKLNAAHTNAVLLLTWFSGNSKQLLGLTGHGMMADSTKYFVVAIDAFGNGVSSSPSNSALQPNGSFPRFNIRDMVKAEHFLATKILKLRHVFCVMGASMGGMQTFQWIVSYPGYMDKAVISFGSPRLSSNDLLLWNAELLAIKEGLECHASEESIENTVVAIDVMNSRTPGYYAKNVPPEQFQKYLKENSIAYKKIFSPWNWMSQLRAMMAQNVSEPFGNNMKRAAEVVKAKVLIIVNKQDHMVNPNPALEFARLIKAKVFELDDDCGHWASVCDSKKINKEVNDFLR